MEKNIYQELNDAYGEYNKLEFIEKYGLHTDYLKLRGLNFIESDFDVERDLFEIHPVDWRKISREAHSEDFIKYHFENIFLEDLMRSDSKLSIKFLKGLIERGFMLDGMIASLFACHMFTESEIEDLVEYYEEKKSYRFCYWDIIWKYQEFTEDFVRKHRNIIRWSALLQNPSIHINEELIDSLSGSFTAGDWYDLAQYYKYFSTEFLRKHWNDISKVTSSFFGKQKISEELLEEHIMDISDLEWNYIARNQKLSKEFILRYMYKLGLGYISSNKNLELSKKDLHDIEQEYRKKRLYN